VIRAGVDVAEAQPSRTSWGQVRLLHTGLGGATTTTKKGGIPGNVHSPRVDAAVSDNAFYLPADCTGHRAIT
jgi:hypothetical protein